LPSKDEARRIAANIANGRIAARDLLIQIKTSGSRMPQAS